MNIASLKKILYLVLIVCHAHSEAHPIRFYNRTANFSAQLGLGNQINGTQHNITSTDNTAGVVSRPWLVPTIIASALLLGACIYAYCKYRRNQMAALPIDDDDHDDEGDDGVEGGDGGEGGGGGYLLSRSLPEPYPVRDLRLNFPLLMRANDDTTAFAGASNFGGLPQPIQDQLRALRRLPMHPEGLLMPPEDADERDFRIMSRVPRNVFTTEILMVDASYRRVFLGHRADLFDIFIAGSQGRIRSLNHLSLYERRVHLASLQYTNTNRQRYRIRSGIETNNRPFETYILVQRVLVNLPDDLVRIINEFVFLAAALDILNRDLRLQFGLEIDYGRFRFYR